MQVRNHAIALAIILWPTLAGAQPITIMGDIAGGATDCEPLAISNDGRYVCGRGSGPFGDRAFRWDATTGLFTEISPFINSPLGPGSATTMSADGSIVAGTMAGSSGTQPFWWTAPDNTRVIGELTTGVSGVTPTDISDDGSIIIGLASAPSGDAAWLAGGAFEKLEFLQSDATFSTLLSANAISGDGSAVFGLSSLLSDPAIGIGVRWLIPIPPENLGPLLPGDGAFLFATDTNGTIAVGRSQTDVEALFWREHTGMVKLGKDPLHGGNTVAEDVSDNGTIIVGRSADAGGENALIWLDFGPPQRLSQLLLSRGVTIPTGYTLRTADLVTPDSRFVCGTADDGAGGVVGYIADLTGTGTANPADLTTTGATLPGQTGFGLPDGKVDLDDLGYFLTIWLIGTP
ncbi:MAG: hypothetical protein AAGB51_10885 [Planctomycetota bacterium]